MKRRKNFMQAYRQAPWRKQVQLIGLISAVLVVLTTGAGIYLHVTAQAATLGREIQFMQDEKQQLQQLIEDQQSELARLTSAHATEERALELGFEPVNPSAALYVVVPGYVGRQPAALAPRPQLGGRGEIVLPPAYTMTLFDWLGQMYRSFTLQSGSGS
jgi:hypothetical protein